MSVLEPHSFFEALEEQIGLAAITGAHMHICHINSVAGRDLEDATNLIKKAQSRGIPVTTEAYTYGAFSTAIGAEFLRGPDWLERFGVEDYSAMESMGKPLSKEKIEELQQTNPGEVVVFHFLDEENSKQDQEILDHGVLYPGGAIASDGVFWANAKGEILEGDVWPIPDDYYSHPRGAGCFSRLFARWVRERGVLSLSDAVAKCSLIPTQILEESVPQMKKKGRVQVGCDADIVVFDPDTIEDKATFVNPRQTSAGFRHVVVNGTPIIEDAERIAAAKPGRAVRRSV